MIMTEKRPLLGVSTSANGDGQNVAITSKDNRNGRFITSLVFPCLFLC
jgi:hypothetical protein